MIQKIMKYFRIGTTLLPFYWADSLYKEYYTPKNINLYDKETGENVIINNQARKQINDDASKIYSLTKNETLIKFAPDLCKTISPLLFLKIMYDDTLRLPLYPLYGLYKVIEDESVYMTDIKRNYTYECSKNFKKPILKDYEYRIKYSCSYTFGTNMSTFRF